VQASLQERTGFSVISKLWTTMTWHFTDSSFKDAHGHTDKNDIDWGLTALLFTGTFKGGDVSFPKLNIRIPVKTGDVLLFNSRLLYHQGDPPTSGTRRCCVLFSDHNVYSAEARYHVEGSGSIYLFFLSSPDTHSNVVTF
jgi:hypothetical protein